jgi:hypothetical protein
MRRERDEITAVQDHLISGDLTKSNEPHILTMTTTALSDGLQDKDTTARFNLKEKNERGTMHD